MHSTYRDTNTLYTNITQLRYSTTCWTRAMALEDIVSTHWIPMRNMETNTHVQKYVYIQGHSKICQQTPTLKNLSRNSDIQKNNTNSDIQIVQNFLIAVNVTLVKVSSCCCRCHSHGDAIDIWSTGNEREKKYIQWVLISQHICDISKACSNMVQSQNESLRLKDGLQHSVLCWKIGR